MIIYKEYSGRNLIKELCFDDLVMIELLYLLQESVFSLKDLVCELEKLLEQKSIKVCVETVKIHLTQLYNEGIVYYSSDFSQITAVIVLDKNMRALCMKK